MVLAKSIYDANGLVIVREGTAMTENTAGRVVDLGIPLVYIEDPRFDDLEVRETADTELVREILEFRHSSRGIIASKRSPDAISLDMETGHRLAQTVLESVQNSTPEEFSLVQHLPAESYWDVHAINSSLLSARLATSLAMDRETVLELVFVCLFHDLSLVLLPKSILQNLGRLEEEEKKALYIHPRLEAEILRRQQGVSAVAIGAIGQHHELWNGEGYPRGLSGESILPVARIVGLVDTYTGLVSERPFRKRLMPHEAIEYILGYADEYFEIDLTDRFSRAVPTYFIGTMVSLNNNQKGVVTVANIGEVARPVVRAITDPNGVPLAKPTDVDLSNPENASLLITAVVDG
jgi:HD-GYP domain-containing protein (c-di-GMP phosphodiesterase class II)